MTQQRESFYAVTILICLSLLFTAPQAHAVKIAVLGSLTGDAAYVNEGMFSGARFAVEELNKHGGVLGEQIQLLEIDNHSHPAGSVEAARKAVQEGVALVIGPMFSSHALAAAVEMEKAGIPMIAPSATAAELTMAGDMVFRGSFTNDFQGAVLARFARKLGKSKGGLLVNLSETYSTTLGLAFQKHFTRLGGKIVVQGGYLKDDNDFSSLLDKVGKAAPEFLFAPGYPRECALLIKQARAKGLDTLIIGSDGYNDKMYTYAKGALQGVVFAKHWHRDFDSQKSKEFVARFEKHAGKIKQDVIALTYDSVCLFAAAASKAGSFAPRKLASALTDLEGFTGATGSFRFNSQGDPVKPLAILQFGPEQSKYIKTIWP